VGGHECLGEEEEQITGERDGEMHVLLQRRNGPVLPWGMHRVFARRLPKSACDDLLSQLTAGSEVNGNRIDWTMLSMIQSDEGDVT
jgi:hypothetical protein